MRDKITQAFDQVHAEETLKASTREYIRRRTRGYTRARQLPGYLRLVPVAACLVLAVLAGNWLYFTPTVEISIDINPSIELGVNRFDRVVTAIGYNADGQALLDTLEVQNLDYNDAVEQIINSDTVASLLSGDGIMTIGVIGPDGNKRPGYSRIWKPALPGRRTCTATTRMMIPPRMPMRWAFPAESTGHTSSCISLTPL